MLIEFKANQRVDTDRMRHYLNDELSVIHCHHYTALLTQLADDAKLLNGPELLSEASEESFYPILVKYFDDNDVETLEDRVSIVEQYFGFIGLGQLKITVEGDGGTAEMMYSHVDEGWMKKWSKREKPVNFVGQGFLAAAFSAITDNVPGSFKVDETASIVSGAVRSRFDIERN